MADTHCLYDKTEQCDCEGICHNAPLPPSLRGEPDRGYMVSESKAQRRQATAVENERKALADKLGKILDANERHENTGLYSQIALLVYEMRGGKCGN